MALLDEKTSLLKETSETRNNITPDNVESNTVDC